MLGAVFEIIFAERILTSLEVVLTIVFTCLALINFMIYWLIQQTNVLRQRVGLHITYIDRERHGRAFLFKSIRQIVEQAEHSIRVLNSSFVESEISDKTDDEVTRKERDKYYEALLKCTTKGLVTYERILQLGSKQTVENLTNSRSYLKHFHRILDEKDKNPDLPLGLLKASAKRLSTFLLVDDIHLIWQINEILPSGAMRMQGIFIIKDPRHEITQHFRASFESIRRNSLGTVKREELPVLTGDLAS